METRRVQVAGGTTFMVSLPVGWARQMGLRAGSEVALDLLADGRVAVSAQPGPREGVREAGIAVAPGDPPEVSLRRIISRYLVGYDLLRVSFAPEVAASQRRALKEGIRRNLAGVEVVEDSGDRLAFQNLLNPEELPLGRALLRMSSIVVSMLEDSLVALRGGDRNLAQDVVQRDSEVDKFYLLAIRQLNTATRHPETARKLGVRDPVEAMGLRVIVKSIERVADHAENIASNSLRLRNHASPMVREAVALGGSAIGLFRGSLESLAERDTERADQVFRGAEEFSRQESALHERLLKNPAHLADRIPLRSILESLGRTAWYGTDIAEIVVNLSVEGPG